jgi:hypothetical protein
MAGTSLLLGGCERSHEIWFPLLISQRFCSLSDFRRRSQATLSVIWALVSNSAARTTSNYSFMFCHPEIQTWSYFSFLWWNCTSWDFSCKLYVIHFYISTGIKVSWNFIGNMWQFRLETLTTRITPRLIPLLYVVALEAVNVKLRLQFYRVCTPRT